MKAMIERALWPSDIYQHLSCIYGLVIGADAKTVIELGVRSGESTVVLAEAVTFTQGILHSVDIGDCSPIQGRLDAYGIGACWRFYQDDSKAFGQKWDRSKPVDIVFLDTSHYYHETVQEIAIFEPLLRPGGLFLFHDTTSQPDGVLRPILEFLERAPGWRFDHHEHCHGLGILRKPG